MKQSIVVRLGRNALAAMVVSLVAVSFYMSAASLIFQGPLAPYLSIGIGAAFASGAVLCVAAALGASMPLTSPGSEPSTVPVLAALTAGLCAQVTAAAALPTALAALAITTTCLGGAWWLMGRRQWGDAVRFIPYPVVGGFLASIGWLMVTGGLGVATGQSFGFGVAWQWVLHGDLHAGAGLGIGLLLLAVTLRWRNVLVLPLTILAVALAMHAALAAAGLDLAAARAQGWLLPAMGRSLPAPLTPGLLAAVDWMAIARESGLIVSAVILGTIGLLLSATSLEVAWDARADLNRDLRVLGLGNVAAAALGGITGGISISRSMANRAAGATGPGANAILALLCVAVMWQGGALIAVVPRALLGGLLAYLGLGMLKAWLLDSRGRLGRGDIATVAGMVAVTAVAGFLPAVCLGVLACCVDFAVASARLAPVRRRVARSAWPSPVERSAEQLRLLRSSGERQSIVELQGALFFGSATLLEREVEGWLAEAPPPERLLFDLRRVRWLDSSGAQALGRLFKQAQRQGVQVELSGASPAARRALHAAGASGPPLHDDIDSAVRRWDDEALSAAGLAEVSFEAELARAMGSADAAAHVVRQFTPVALAEGEVLFREGDAADALYLVRRGRLAAVVGHGEHAVAVRTTQAGGTIGEMALFRAARRSASVRAETDCELLRLGLQELEALQQSDPAAAAALYRHFLRQLAERLDQSTAQATALAR